MQFFFFKWKAQLNRNLLFASGEILGKLQNLSVPPFLYMLSGDISVPASYVDYKCACENLTRFKLIKQKLIKLR